MPNSGRSPWRIPSSLRAAPPPCSGRSRGSPPPRDRRRRRRPAAPRGRRPPDRRRARGRNRRSPRDRRSASATFSATAAEPGLPGATKSFVSDGDFASAAARACSRAAAAENQNVHRLSLPVLSRPRGAPEVGGGLSNSAPRGQTRISAKAAEPGFDAAAAFRRKRRREPPMMAAEPIAAGRQQTRAEFGRLGAADAAVALVGAAQDRAFALEIGQHEARRLRRQALGAGDLGVAQARRLGDRLQHRILGQRDAEIGERPLNRQAVGRRRATQQVVEFWLPSCSARSLFCPRYTNSNILGKAALAASHADPMLPSPALRRRPLGVLP